MIPKFKPFSAL